ncbi:hypothetical protein DH2020_049681 [Rehmannia glutinosa]|uniref:F-box domain-containing protein n=1 Tax=Rehmannia glutinosa TaxID=99300 RepID=A0ABR0U391_REHGL
MASNYSHWPVFPAHTSEENVLSPMRIVNGYLAEGVSDKNEDYARPWHAKREEFEEWRFNSGKDRIDRFRSPESNSKDIVDLLPSDPFGMDIETTFTAITGWLEDLEVDYGGYFRSKNGRVSQENYGLFAGWNLIWNNALKFQPFPDNNQFSHNGIQPLSNPQVDEKPHVGTHSFSSSIPRDEKLNVAGTVNQYEEERDMGGALASYDFEFQPACNEGGIVGLSNESSSCSSELQFGEKVGSDVKSEGVPHEALLFALSCLGVKDLLSVERVCKSLHSTVRGEFYLWRSIHIDQPLNERITDDLLLQLACRAQGNLQCLSLVECPKVTDDGIRRILETNPRLTKLFVPGCTRLTIDGILNNIKIHNSNKGVPGIKHLRIGGVYGVTHEHFEELKLLLGPNDHEFKSFQKPHFYHRGNFYLPFDDDRAIDIEMCPRCEKVRLVYECPAEGCQVKDMATQACRACTFCIARCARCGRCISDNEYEETFCLDFLCSDCYKQTP